MLRNFFKIIFIKTFIWEYLILIKNYLNIKFGKYYANDKIDIILEEYINYRDGFYIEIGANDGVRQSNTLYLEKFKNWHGILVEPSKRFVNLVKNRNNKNFFFNVACCSFGTTEKFKSLHYADLFTLPDNIYKKKDKQKFKENIYYHTNDKFEEFKVKQKTLNELLIISNAPKIIDFFSLDVEGDELNLLKGINYNTYKFKYLLVEGNDIYVAKFLKSKNYKILRKLRNDTLYHFF